MKFRSFTPLRPPRDLAPHLASPPYDVVDSEEARRLADGNPHSFLHVVKPEIDLPEGISLYDDRVYAKAAENFLLFQEQGWLQREAEPGLFLYRQSFQGHAQTGIVGVCHVADYEQNLIKKHEKTLQKKEDDRTRHVCTLQANAGPVFLMVRRSEALSACLQQADAEAPEVDFTSADGVRHSVWRVADPPEVSALFAEIPCAYVADGHHRSASAARSARACAEANPAHTGEEDYNWFMAVVFPADALQVLPYNRLILDLGGLEAAEFLSRVRDAGGVCEPCDTGQPQTRGDLRMRLPGQWYRLTLPPAETADPVAALDVSRLQDLLLGPVLGIEDPRTNPRIAFKGGYDAVARLAAAVDSGRAALAFSLYPTSTEEVMDVADAGLIMPPKSTWFEPKLKSGLFIHTFS